MYSVGIKIDDIENPKRSSGLFHVIIGLFLIIKTADYYRYQDYTNFFVVIPFLAIGSISLFYGFFRRKLDLTYRYNFWLRLLQITSFLLLGLMIIGKGDSIHYFSFFAFVLITGILLFSERRIAQETNILIDESGLKIPGITGDHLIKWEELENVVVREDFITIFHRKQKFLQYQVKQDLSTLEVAKMNAFCREMIEKGETIPDYKMNTD